ncbi:MAG: bifunctional 4-hydroxy-3-methylbut-2-enyl diphosphate reductase/30S ribosomal protein S1 [Tissierellales bacterium]|jgi:4-hydroxy-3-methylbut-2-enyl diphosphate reductase|nr:bifunctional 4-hydroxy-3-methylbut-2-enyl diphosphate reductase/30S ribosomal protein S1 [Tissierellales bacterium]
MRVVKATYSGFCYGVKKSIELVERTLSENEEVYSIGPVIHNAQIIEKLEESGLKVIDEKNLKTLYNRKVIIRAHGVAKAIYDQLVSQNCEIIDTTCPNVKLIQEKVESYSLEGYQVVIVGDFTHPEVIGIKGWSKNDTFIVKNPSECDKIEIGEKVLVVSQTTNKESVFWDCANRILEKQSKAVVLNTICDATEKRQNACMQLAKSSDAMIIIGGYHSSNTKKLKEIASLNCENVFHIERACELDLAEIMNYEIIGVIAGASTPDWIIEEVVNKMNNMENNDMMKMMEEYEKGMSAIRPGEVVEGTVIIVNDNEAMINIGYKADGIIAKDELTEDPDAKASDILKEGDTVKVLILRMSDEDGNVVLSKKRVDNIVNWEELEKMYNENEYVDAKVVKTTKGGVIAIVNNVSGFIPASLLSTRFVKDLESYVNREFKVKIKEIDTKRNRLILSRKEIEKIEDDARKEKVFSKLEEGMTREGEVVRLADFGAFVDIDGVDGLIHISEMSWGRIKHPSEILKVGQKVQVYVISFDKSKEKISLSLKKTLPNPWSLVEENYPVNSTVEGVVRRMTDFGAFVELEPGIDGLVHVSQIAYERVNKPSDVLSVGEKVNVKVLSIDLEEKKISLSIKETLEKPVVETEEVVEVKKEEEPTSYTTEEPEVTIGDMMNQK